MSWNVVWLDQEETIILIKLIGNWSWGDLEASGARALAMLTSKPYTVHTICDLTEGSDLPDNKALGPMMRLYASRTTNGGFKVLVGATQLMQTAISVMTKVMGGASYFRYADSVEEAAVMVSRLPARNGR